MHHTAGYFASLPFAPFDAGFSPLATGSMGIAASFTAFPHRFVSFPEAEAGPRTRGPS